MFDVPERPPAANHRNAREIVFGGRRRYGPLQSPGVPRIIASEFSPEHRVKKIAYEDENRHALDQSTDGDDEVPQVPTTSRLVGVDASRHAQKSGDVHEVK